MIVHKDEYKVLMRVSDVVWFLFRKLLCLSRISCAKITSFFTLSLLICFETVLLSAVSDCSKTFTVSWNTSNPIFRQDNDGHIIHVNKGNTQFEYDQVNIVCPNYTPGTHEDDGEKYIIYNVSKEEYETCRITNPVPRVIAVCDKPHTMLYYTITFRPFTPQPGGLEFPPGHDYYFISTSSKDDLHRRIGGRCQSHNMKVIFKVCCKAEDYNYDVPSKNAHGALEPTVATSPRVFTPRIRLTTASNIPSSYQGKSTIAPDASVQQPSFNKPSKKKPNDNQNHPNEIVKNEELTHSTSLSIPMVTSLSFFYIQLIAIVSFLVTFLN